MDNERFIKEIIKKIAKAVGVSVELLEEQYDKEKNNNDVNGRIRKV